MYVVSERRADHRAPRHRTRDDRVGHGLSIDRILRIAYELSEELYLSVHRGHHCLYRQRM